MDSLVPVYQGRICCHNELRQDPNAGLLGRFFEAYKDEKITWARLCTSRIFRYTNYHDRTSTKRIPTHDILSTLVVGRDTHFIRRRGNRSGRTVVLDLPCPLWDLRDRLRLGSRILGLLAVRSIVPSLMPAGG